MTGGARTMVLRRAQQILDVIPAYKALLRFPRNVDAPRHSLAGQLVVSVTSFPPRYGVLANTLKSLLDQSVKPSRTILWIAKQDWHALPAAVRQLEAWGLEILQCDDLRSFKKIIPVLERWPNSFVVTADDDLFYEPNWLQTIVAGFSPSDPAIICRRAHVPRRDSTGRLAPYETWEPEVEMAPESSPREVLFPTGVGGVLYYPGSLAPEVINRTDFLELCPRADDVWLYWMGRMAGSRYRQVGGRFKQVSWPRSQRSSLQSRNIGLRDNDRQIRAMEERYGSY